MTRLFLTLPDPLPENLVDVAWRLPGAVTKNPTAKNSTAATHGVAATPAVLPAAAEIWLVLPASRVLLTSLALSRRALRQLRGALGNALEDQLMLDPALVHVALGKTQVDAVNPVAVVEIAWLEQALALCRQHGIEPYGAIPETLLWQGDGATAGQWSARWQGAAGFVRTGASAGFALDDGDAETPPLALQLALTEARRNGRSPECIALEAAVEVSAEAWSHKLGCPVQLQVLQADPLPPVLNLLQGAYAARRHGWVFDLAGNLNLSNKHLGKMKLVAGVLLAALGVHVLATLADWGRLANENKQLRGEMRQVFQAAFPQTRAIVDPTLQMQRQLADLRRAQGYAETGDFLHALNAVSTQVSGVAGMQYDNARLTLLQPRATDLDGLRSALQSQGYLLSTAGDPDNRTVSLERSPK